MTTTTRTTIGRVRKRTRRTRRTRKIERTVIVTTRTGKGNGGARRAEAETEGETVTEMTGVVRGAKTACCTAGVSAVLYSGAQQRAP